MLRGTGGFTSCPTILQVLSEWWTGVTHKHKWVSNTSQILLNQCSINGTVQKTRAIFTTFLCQYLNKIWDLEQQYDTDTAQQLRKQDALWTLRWNSLTSFLVEVSGHKLESSQTRVFVWISTLTVFFRSTDCYSWKESSFADFNVRILKTRVE
jgi:hypothetical protein